MRVCALLVALSLSAGAVESPEVLKPPVLVAALKGGGVFPQVLNRLSTTYSFGVELGWLLPILNRQLSLSAELAYSAPAHDQTVSDARVPGGSYSYTVVEKTLGLYIGPKYYLFPVSGRLTPWLSVGVRVQFIDSQMVGAADQPFGQHDETGTHVAFGGQVGIGYRVGPGFILLELQMISAPLDHLITGKVDIGDLAIRVGYAFTL